LGGSNLRTTSKNLRTASSQIFKAKNQFVDESIVDGPQKRSKRVNYTALRSGNLDDYNSGLIQMYVWIKINKKYSLKKKFGKI
jgi:hypothetical protein